MQLMLPFEKGPLEKRAKQPLESSLEPGVLQGWVEHGDRPVFLVHGRRASGRTNAMVPAGGLCIFPLWLAALQLMQLIGLPWRCGQLIIWFGNIKHVQSSNMCNHAIKSESSGSEISNMFLAIVYQCLPFLSVKSQYPRNS